MYDLSRNEELILLSIWRLKDDAYGVAIRRNVMEYTKRELHYGSLYNTLEILNRKGYVRLEKG
ncbi:MAG: PadR family transcriptional regulator, partial [bacterium]|nr:PadR family transcriptional regulator [bacterium]